MPRFNRRFTYGERATVHEKQQMKADRRCSCPKTSLTTANRSIVIEIMFRPLCQNMEIGIFCVAWWRHGIATMRRAQFFLLSPRHLSSCGASHNRRTMINGAFTSRATQENTHKDTYFVGRQMTIIIKCSAWRKIGKTENLYSEKIEENYTELHVHIFHCSLLLETLKNDEWRMTIDEYQHRKWKKRQRERKKKK